LNSKRTQAVDVFVEISEDAELVEGVIALASVSEVRLLAFNLVNHWQAVRHAYDSKLLHAHMVSYLKDQSCTRWQSEQATQPSRRESLGGAPGLPVQKVRQGTLWTSPLPTRRLRLM
jgi:hypothetical protein